MTERLQEGSDFIVRLNNPWKYEPPAAKRSFYYDNALLVA